MKTFVQKGDSLTMTATSTVKSGSQQLVGDLFGIAMNSAEPGEEYELALIGVYEDQPKVEAQAWGHGVSIYWDDSAGMFTTVDTDNLRVGHAAEAASNPSPTGVVRLSGASG